MTDMEKENLKLWNKLEKTNPDHTKKVPSDYGKMITTIDAMHQIKNMTAAFGPIGKGWTYEAKYHYTDKLVFAEIKIKYCLDSQWREYGPVCSVAPLGHTKGKNVGKLDTEAPKKAMTDALTKAFSHVGLNADVFLGKFDSNKYVQQMEQEFNAIDDFAEQNSTAKAAGSVLKNNTVNTTRRQHNG